MAETGFTLVSVGTDEGGGNVSAWTNPGNITADDAAIAQTDNLGTSVNEDSNFTNYLHGTGLGFSVPSGTINGIAVRINGWSSSDARRVKASTIQLLKSNARVGNNLATGTVWDFDSANLVDYGGPTELWGTTWTSADVNSSGFGVGMQWTPHSTASSQAIIRVDAVWINVYYTEGGGATGNRLIMW